MKKIAVLTAVIFVFFVSVYTFFYHSTGRRALASVQKEKRLAQLPAHSLLLVWPGTFLSRAIPLLHPKTDGIIPLFNPTSVVHTRRPLFIAVPRETAAPQPIVTDQRPRYRGPVHDIYAVHPVAGRMIDELSRLSVTALDGSPARRKGQKIQYGKKSWQFVGPRYVTIKGVKQKCLWIHPEKEPITVRWATAGSSHLSISFIPVDTADKTVALQVKYHAVSARDHEQFSLRIHPDADASSVTFKEGPYSFVTITVNAEQSAKNHWCLAGQRW